MTTQELFAAGSPALLALPPESKGLLQHIVANRVHVIKMALESATTKGTFAGISDGIGAAKESADKLMEELHPFFPEGA